MLRSLLGIVLGFLVAPLVFGLICVLVAVQVWCGLRNADLFIGMGLSVAAAVIGMAVVSKMMIP